MPDLIQPIIGFRSWDLEDGLLRSTGVGAAIWDPDVTVAECETGRDKVEASYVTEDEDDELIAFAMAGRKEEPKTHSAPAPNCGCGLYAYHDPIDPSKQASGLYSIMYMYADRPSTPRITGAIAAWGQIEVHETGFRAEKARIVALCLDDKCATDKDRRKQIEDAAKTYGAEAVPTVYLPDAAYQHGIETPKNLRPKPPEPEPTLAHKGILSSSLSFQSPSPSYWSRASTLHIPTNTSALSTQASAYWSYPLKKKSIHDYLKKKK